MIATLPPPISALLETEIARFSANDIERAATELSLGYRGLAAIREGLSPRERAAYLSVRFPSTFAAAEVVWREAARAIPALECRTLLDVGAGPGTASLAAPMDARITRLERDSGWREIGDRLAEANCRASAFHHAALSPAMKLAPHDVVIACYALGELREEERASIVAALWRLARHALIVIEPGTPKGFEIVQAVRTYALTAEGHAAAPCTHDARCPMTRADWCHRAIRVTRTQTHRKAKRAELGHEDEKFAFVVMARDPPTRLAPGRIVRKPIRNSGHVHLDLCEASGLARRTIARSAGPLYRRARDAEWGDLWPPQDD